MLASAVTDQPAEAWKSAIAGALYRDLLHADPTAQHYVLMQIVRLAPGDEALLEVAARQFRGVEGVDQSAFLRDPATVVLLMTNDAEVVGWVWGLRQRHVCGYSQLQLYELVVTETMRRRGIGRALVGAFLEVARTEGHQKVWLFTTEGNLAAKALYEAMGGGPSGREKAGYWWNLA